MIIRLKLIYAALVELFSYHLCDLPLLSKKNVRRQRVFKKKLPYSGLTLIISK